MRTSPIEFGAHSQLWSKLKGFMMTVPPAPRLMASLRRVFDGRLAQVTKLDHAVQRKLMPTASSCAALLKLPARVGRSDRRTWDPYAAVQADAVARLWPVAAEELTRARCCSAVVPPANDRFRRERTFTVVHRNGVSWSRAAPAHSHAPRPNCGRSAPISHHPKADARSCLHVPRHRARPSKLGT